MEQDMKKLQQAWDYLNRKLNGVAYDRVIGFLELFKSQIIDELEEEMKNEA